MAPGDTTKSHRRPWRDAERRKVEIAMIAEEHFAIRGYDGVSIRDIATAAGVNSALIGYHFGAKEQLYRSLFDRRYREIQKKRGAALAAAQIEPGSPESLAAVVKAWLPPLMELANDPASRFFVLMLARESSLSAWDAHGIYADLLNPAARICQEALQRIAPDAKPRHVAQGYEWMVGVASSTLLGAARNDRLEPGDEPINRDALLQSLLKFVTAGLQAHLLPGA